MEKRADRPGVGLLFWFQGLDRNFDRVVRQYCGATESAEEIAPLSSVSPSYCSPYFVLVRGSQVNCFRSGCQFNQCNGAFGSSLNCCRDRFAIGRSIYVLPWGG
jgi:hypothetical protein